MTISPLVCIVDDNLDYQLILKHLLGIRLPTYTIRFFASGETFLSDLVQMKSKPGLIILDRHMPVLNGHQVLVRLKQDDSLSQIPVIMISADASREEMEACYRAGASSFLRKDAELFIDELVTLCQYWMSTVAVKQPGV